MSAEDFVCLRCGDCGVMCDCETPAYLDVRDGREVYLAMQRLVRAVAFYANENNWQSPSRGFAAQYDPELSPIAKDRGVIARAATERTP